MDVRETAIYDELTARARRYRADAERERGSVAQATLKTSAAALDRVAAAMLLACEGRDAIVL